MSDGEDVNLVGGDQEGDVVGKPPDPGSPDHEVVRKAIDRTPGLRPAGDGCDRQVDGGKEGKAQAGVALLVPSGRLFDLS